MNSIHYLNKLEVAERLGTTKRGVEEMMRRRKIPFLKLGHRTVRFDWTAVEKAVARLEYKAVGQEARTK
ncbi:MAG: excisionase family DNA-binding protein [Verrucomicrobia bacterium]|nr:excisionase family DNA-binding protein [Verrucomicrobiota bacterium]